MSVFNNIFSIISLLWARKESCCSFWLPNWLKLRTKYALLWQELLGSWPKVMGYIKMIHINKYYSAQKYAFVCKLKDKVVENFIKIRASFVIEKKTCIKVTKNIHFTNHLRFRKKPVQSESLICSRTFSNNVKVFYDHVVKWNFLQTTILLFAVRGERETKMAIKMRMMIRT